MKIKSLLAWTVATALAAVAAQAADLAAEGDSLALRTAVQTCATCHGVNGRSVSPTFPNLAAQSAPYIEAQLKAFKEQTRSDPDAQAYMWGMASQLNDGLITELAAYFARQPAAPGKPGDPQLIARGKHLFEEGVPAKQIPPCASCHGDRAQGQAAFPRLAGQHSPYLLKQILVIQNALRSAPVMHGVVKQLDKDQIEALVVYLESI